MPSRCCCCDTPGARLVRDRPYWCLHGSHPEDPPSSGLNALSTEPAGCHSVCHSTRRYSGQQQRTGWTSHLTRPERTASASTRWMVASCLVTADASAPSIGQLRVHSVGQRGGVTPTRTPTPPRSLRQSAAPCSSRPPCRLPRPATSSCSGSPTETTVGGCGRSRAPAVMAPASPGSFMPPRASCGAGPTQAGCSPPRRQVRSPGCDQGGPRSVGS